MTKLLLVFIGGGLGAMSRFILTTALAGKLGNFPLGTLAANFFGSLLMGLVVGILAGRFESVRLFVAVGFLGGFTTFSSFSAETLALIQGGQIFSATANVIVSVLASLIACAVGLKISG
ncbi:MAG: fluoride efflux transporter CrcB [Selenomonadaceae bacterium]|nr:fluoride efflux transporter CrcB [Selenomonadaceae bacterium]MBQ7723813.1 fluoride efflux transporter CrcB [Selenomonadaceae bacterium]